MNPGYTGGIEVEARSFLAELFKVDDTTEYTLLLPSETRFDFDWELYPNFHPRFFNGPGDALRKRLYHKMPPPTAGQKIDVVLALPGYISTDLISFPYLLCVPDLQHEYRPDFFTAQELANRRKIYTGSIQQADHICASSQFTRQTILDRMGVRENKVSVVYLAASKIFQPVIQPQDEAILAKYGLGGHPYLFYPAATWVHKNHRVLFEALARFRQAVGMNLKLVCTGPAKEAHPDLLRQRTELGLDEQIIFLGYCPFEDLAVLYRHAFALVFPSLFEGFGMPLVEAMASGCPVISSQVTCLPEIGGEAALYFDPSQPGELADKIRQLCEYPVLRDELIRKGLLRSRLFSWENYTVEILARLLQIGNPGCSLEDSREAVKHLVTKPSNQPDFLPDRRVRVKISRLRGARMRWQQGQTDWRKGRRLAASGNFIAASLLAPDFAFYVGIYPAVQAWRGRSR